MTSSLAGLLVKPAAGAPVDLTAPLTAATTGYAAPRLSPTVQAVTQAPKTPTVAVPSVALAAVAKQTPGPNLTGQYAKIGAQLRAKQTAPVAPQAGVSAPGSPTTPAATGAPAPHGIVAAAKTMLGVPYVWGGTSTTKGLDCSAFVQAAYAKIGIQIPRTTYTQFAAGTPVNLKQIQPGDAVYVEPDKNGLPGHTGLYIGNGQVQESPHTGTVNQVVPLAVFLHSGFVGVRRF